MSAPGIIPEQPTAFLPVAGAVRTFAALLLAGFVLSANAADITVDVGEAPAGGDVVILLFDSASAFGDFRDPVRREVFSSSTGPRFVVHEVAAGTYALMAFHDADGDGALDRNFIGIPTEPVAFSSGYRPKGPPAFDRARFFLGEQQLEMELDLFRALGRRGRLGVGVGVVSRTSPYRDFDETVHQPIPAVTYIGDRLQLLGPSAQVGLFGSERLRLAATVSLRFGAYDEDDSPIFAGLGDRETTAMIGLAMEAELPNGFDLSTRYEHDALDRIGGGRAELGIEKSFAIGLVRISPGFSLKWLSADLAGHDYGVPVAAASQTLEAYEPGSTILVVPRLGAFVELTDDWRVVGNLWFEHFGHEITASPLVDNDHAVGGFFALNHVF